MLPEWKESLRDYYNANPRKRVEVQRQILENDIENFKKQECEIQLEIEHKESLITKLTTDEADVCEEELSYELPPGFKEGIHIIQAAFDSKRNTGVSSRLSDKENIDNFIKKYDEFIVSKYDDFFSELGFQEFKELLYSEIKV